MTYNHGNYIEEALKGIDIQKTNFSFEVVVGDDFSTDDTLCKIKKYEFTNPNLNLRILERNLGDAYHKVRKKKGRLYNFVDILNNCTGNYIALLDGDDYWTDPLKLQKQVDFLKKNEDFGACFTNAIIANHIVHNKSEYNTPYQLREGVVSNEIIFKNGGGIYPTATLVFRKKNIAISDLAINEMSGDELLIFILANKTKIKYLDFISAVYNRWHGGVFSGIMANKKQMLEYRINEIVGYTKLLGSLKSENTQLLKQKRKQTALYVLENSIFKWAHLKYITIVGGKTFIKKIFFK